MRNLYPHAYQSFLWNTCASLRLKDHGHKLILGDLVLKKNNKNQDQIISENKNDKVAEEDEAEDFERLTESDFIAVDRAILDSGEYTISDVYIPIFGSEFKFGDTEGPNCVISHKIYKELTHIEGIEVADLKRLETNFMVQGGWRRLIGQAEDLDWRLVHHDTKDVDLVSMYSSIGEVSDVVLDTTTDENCQKKPAGEHYKSLLLEFSLKKSSYATMLIREILNTSSSLKIQNDINEKVKAL